MTADSTTCKPPRPRPGRGKNRGKGGSDPTFGPSGYGDRSRPFLSAIPASREEISDRNQVKEIDVSIIKKPAAPPRIVTLEVQIEEPALHKLKAYADFIDSTSNHVVATALNLVFKKDYDFKRWLKAKTTAEKSSTADKPAVLVPKP
jgi:hypothetical protein